MSAKTTGSKTPPTPPATGKKWHMPKPSRKLLAILCLLAALGILAFVLITWWPFGHTGDGGTKKPAPITATTTDTTVAEDQAVQVCMDNWRLSGRPVPADLEAQCAIVVATLYKAPPSAKGQSIP